MTVGYPERPERVLGISGARHGEGSSPVSTRRRLSLALLAPVYLIAGVAVGIGIAWVTWLEDWRHG